MLGLLNKIAHWALSMEDLVKERYQNFLKITFIVERREATKIHERSDRWLETQRNSRAKL